MEISGEQVEDLRQAEKLAVSVLENLRYQHDWSQLQIHTHSPSEPNTPLARFMVSGLPPRRLYLHPDDQIELLRTQETSMEKLMETPETEWVLPTHLAEKWTLKAFAAVFDSIPKSSKDPDDRPKRLLLATAHDDSTVQYYIMHDGVVKPRPN